MKIISDGTKLLVWFVIAALVMAAVACGADTTPSDTTPSDTTPSDTTPSDTTPSDTTPSDTTPSAMPDSAMPDKAFAFNGNFDFATYGVPAPTAFNEAPMLAALVASGDLPPVEERLPKEPLIIPVVERIGDYGGTWRRAFTGPNDGQNADRLMHDHVLYFEMDEATVVPHLAKGWEESADKREFTIFLREGMKWSDGHPFTADDFVFAYEDVLIDEDINKDRLGRMGFSDLISVVTKVDDYTVKYSFEEPTPGFISDYAQYTIGGLSRHGRAGDSTFFPAHYMKQFHPKYADPAEVDKMTEDAGFDSWPQLFKAKADIGRNTELPVVGPWVVTSPNTTEKWEFERNPYYHAVDPAGNQLPYIDRISMQLAADKDVLQLRAAAGDIDFQHRHIFMNKVPVFFDNAESSNIMVRYWPQGGAQAGLVFNQTWTGEEEGNPDPEMASWLRNRDFRIALGVAVDREEINEVVLLGTGKLKNGTYHSRHAFYPGEETELKFIEFNSDKANQMLDDLGLTQKDAEGYRLRNDGKGPIVLELLYVTNYFVDSEAMTNTVSRNWKDVGIKTTIKGVDVNLWAGRRRGNKNMIYVGAGMFTARHVASVASVTSDWAPLIGEWFISDGEKGVEPYTPELKRLVEIYEDTLPMKYLDRKELYIEAQNIIADQQYFLGFVGDTPALNGVIVMKNNFKNVPELAPNDSLLQNPGIARTEQFFLEGGKNDAE